MDWTSYLPANGSVITAPPLPDATLVLDQSTEVSGLPASTLFGTISSAVTIGSGKGAGSIVLDGNNRQIIIYNGTTAIITEDASTGRILVSDGTNNRVLLGKF